jgi:Flp pilus assembly protein TadG
MRIVRNHRRSQRGLLGTFLVLAVIIIAIALGTLAVDIGHIVAVKQELQGAVDAAAIAGAQSLSTDHSKVEAHAREVCRRNIADGLAVDDVADEMEVTVDVTQNTATTPGQVRVTAVIESPTLLARLFNCFSTQMTCTAVAGGFGTIVQMNGMNLFPLAVSIDDSRLSMNIRPLNELHPGDTHEFIINSQQWKNAAFTSFSEPTTNANWIKTAIAQSLGIPVDSEVSIPPVQVGDDINLANGVLGQKALADSPYYDALLAKEIIYLAVVEGTVPFNQSRPLIGFIGVRVNSITVNHQGGVVEKISVTIEKPLTTGVEGILSSATTAQNTTTINEMSPITCKLIE